MITTRKLNLNSLILVMLLAGVAFGQKSVPRQEYFVEGFTGGLNVVTDSIDLARNEMVTADNFTMDRFGALHKRFGIEAWNGSLISVDTIMDIHYVEDKNSDRTLFIATNNFIYELKNWTDTVTVWAGKEIDYTTGRIITDTTAATGHVKGVFGQEDSMGWSLVADPGDLMVIGDSTYTIDSVYADTLLLMTTAVDLHDTTTYRLIKSVKGIPNLTSWNGNLYVADDGGEPWWYDDDHPQLLGIIDSGTVLAAFATVDTIPDVAPYLTVYTRGNMVYVDAGADFDTTFIDGSACDSTDHFFVFTYIVGEKKAVRNRDRNRQQYKFEAVIESAISLGTDTIALVLDRDVIGSAFDPPLDNIAGESFTITNTTDDGHNWWFRHRAQRTDDLNQQYITVKGKSYAPEDYMGFFIFSENDATKASLITGNTSNRISFDSTFTITADDTYYIAWQFPGIQYQTLVVDRLPNGSAIFRDSAFIELVRFKQIYFHRNRLYGIGYQISAGNGVTYWGAWPPQGWEDLSQGDTMNVDRVWFADLGRPFYIPADFNFDISGGNRSGSNLSMFTGNACQKIFGLRDNLYVVTDNNLYEISGEPVFGPEDLFLSQIINGVGSNQPGGVVTTKDNIAYIMNQQGIWWFNGSTTNKISFSVDPLVERYRNSRMTAGKFKDNLFFSYPDSNKTLLYFDPLKKFYGPWTIGMLAINDQSVAIDSNYFLFSRVEDSAYVLKYPRDNTNYTDILVPGDTSVIFAHYKSGWQAKAIGTLRDKVVQDIEITAFNPVCVNEAENYVSLNTDFGGSSWDSTAFACGSPIHNFNNIGIRAKAFQVEVKDSTEFDFYLSNYLLRWYKGDGGR